MKTIKSLDEGLKKETSMRLSNCHQECINFMKPFLNTKNFPLLEVSLDSIYEENRIIHGGLFYDENSKKMNIKINDSYGNPALTCCNNCWNRWLLTRDYICAHETGHYLHLLENPKFFKDYEASRQEFRKNESFESMSKFSRLDTFREFVAEIFSLAYFFKLNKLESVIDFCALSYSCSFDLPYGFFINNHQYQSKLFAPLKFSGSESVSFMDIANTYSLVYPYPLAKSSEDYFSQCCNLNLLS